MDEHQSRTPKRITPKIRALCAELVPDAEPVYLDVVPEPGTRPLDCFENVTRYIERHGGGTRYGWQIWEWPGIMVEAEFHAAWVSPEGALLDITPKEYSVSSILFLPDTTANYDGRQVNNVRRPLIDAPLVHEFIDVNDRIFEVMNRGHLAYEHGRVSLPAAEILPLRRRHAQIQDELRARMAAAFARARRNDPCPCQSGMKYKKCCAK